MSIQEKYKQNYILIMYWWRKSIGIIYLDPSALAASCSAAIHVKRFGSLLQRNDVGRRRKWKFSISSSLCMIFLFEREYLFIRIVIMILYIRPNEISLVSSTEINQPLTWDICEKVHNQPDSHQMDDDGRHKSSKMILGCCDSTNIRKIHLVLAPQSCSTAVRISNTVCVCTHVQSKHNDWMALLYSVWIFCMESWHQLPALEYLPSNTRMAWDMVLKYFVVFPHSRLLNRSFAMKNGYAEHTEHILRET